MKKQFVLIMTDTQRWDMVNCYRETGLKTPCIDALAASGVRYERAYTTQPVCGPARAGLFTGMYPACTGSWGNGMPLGETVKTVGQRLRDNGFHCAYIGKWHLDGTDYFGDGRCADGWDDEYWYDMRRYLDELTADERVKSRVAQSMKFAQFPEEFTYGGRVARRAIDFMQRYADEDYFLVVSFDEPHGPYLCPPPYDTMYRDYTFPKSPAVWDDLAHKPAHQRVWADDAPHPDRDAVTLKKPYFFGCNSYADHLIGEVVDAAPASAAILYTSDHGDALEHHQLTQKGPAAYDDIARIPLILRLPDGARGVYDRRAVSHISVVPTVLEYFGLPRPKMLAGESILATGRDLDADAPEYVHIEFTRYEQDHDGFGGFQPMRAVTDGRWKLGVNLMGEDELYDLAADPHELTNRIDDPAAAPDRDRLHDAMLARMCVDRDPFRGYYWERRPWRTDAPAASWRWRGYTRQAENEEYAPRQLDYQNGLEMVHATRKKGGKAPKFDSVEALVDYWTHYDD